MAILSIKHQALHIGWTWELMARNMLYIIVSSNIFKLSQTHRRQWIRGLLIAMPSRSGQDAFCSKSCDGFAPLTLDLHCIAANRGKDDSVMRCVALSCVVLCEAFMSAFGTDLILIQGWVWDKTKPWQSLGVSQQFVSLTHLAQCISQRNTYILHCLYTMVAARGARSSILSQGTTARFVESIMFSLPNHRVGSIWSTCCPLRNNAIVRPQFFRILSPTPNPKRPYNTDHRTFHCFRE